MRELKIYAPTYYKHAVDPKIGIQTHQEFDEPRIPIVVRSADGLRVVLGSHDYFDDKAPDIQIERRPAGWILFLRPLGGGDPSGHIYFLDDGRSFLVPESPLGSTPPTVLCHHEEEIAEIDKPME